MSIKEKSLLVRKLARMRYLSYRIRGTAEVYLRVHNVPAAVVGTMQLRLKAMIAEYNALRYELDGVLYA